MCGCGREPRAVVVEGKTHKVKTCDVRLRERGNAGGESLESVKRAIANNKRV